MKLFQQLLLQFILILLNAFFASAEIAVISLNETKLKAHAEDGDKKAAKILKMVEEPTRFLSTIQVGITLAGFLGSAFAAENFADRLSAFFIRVLELSPAQSSFINGLSVVLITLILSFFTLVFGELVPKRLAMRHKDKLANAVCGIISFLSAVLRPIVWFLTVSTNCTLRILGIDPNEKDETVSEEDIVIMLDAGVDEGRFDENDIEYIKNVFKLDGMFAKDVMTPRKSLLMVEKNATDEEIMEIIENEGFSRIPVYDDIRDNIIGIFHCRDFLLNHAKPDFKLEDIMFSPVFVPEAAKLDALFKDMQKEHQHIVVVINEHGETAGIVTMEDILEEIVGEIWDETDEAVEDILKTSEDTYRVLCTTAIESFFEFFSLRYEEGSTDATTVNGWITELIGSIPEKGFTFDYENLFIEVTVADDLMAHEISVKVHEKTDDEEENEDEE
ncbi:MAG: HlyC/CorC family transporter [Clostridia bacterium]|nr:HlyC/CorC family transporter [Clostridia bacterium]